MFIFKVGILISIFNTSSLLVLLLLVLPLPLLLLFLLLLLIFLDLTVATERPVREDDAALGIQRCEDAFSPRGLNRPRILKGWEWLSKLWSLFGSPLYYGTYYLGTQKGTLILTTTQQGRDCFGMFQAQGACQSSLEP